MVGVLTALLLLLLLAPAALADSVLPSEKVRSRVMLREKPTRHSRPIGSLLRAVAQGEREALRGFRRIAVAEGLPRGRLCVLPGESRLARGAPQPGQAPRRTRRIRAPLQ